jgi:hypothetical protein
VMADIARGQLVGSSTTSLDNHERQAMQQIIPSLVASLAATRNRIEVERHAANAAKIEARAATIRQTHRNHIASAQQALETLRENGAGARLTRLPLGRIDSENAEMTRRLDDLEHKRRLTVTWRPIGLVHIVGAR